MPSKRVVLNSDMIFAYLDLPKTWVETPEWGKGSGVFMRGMTGEERDQFEAKVSGLESGTSIKMNYVNIRATLVSMCAVNNEGDRIFKSSDVGALGCKSAVVLDRLFDIARSASGIGDNDMKELAKN